MAKSLYGLDFNRNFAANWAPEHRQPGSGPYPFSEPETRTVADFMLSHKNIGATLAYHTAIGVFLRPFAHQSDAKMPPNDLALYKLWGEIGEEETGFPLFSIYHDLTWDPARPSVGSFPEWAYEALGILGLEIELWDLPKQAGVKRQGVSASKQKTKRQREEEELKLLQWNDQELQGKGFINWYSYEHPQLGRVELGGWNSKYVRQNIPGHLLENEIKGSAIFTIRQAAGLPLLQIEKLQAEKLTDSLQRIDLVAVNSGYLPTNITDMAVRLQVAKPVAAKLELGTGLTLVAGEEKTELGHIAGFGKRQASWVVQGHGTAKVTVWSEKAGIVTQEVKL